MPDPAREIIKAAKTGDVSPDPHIDGFASGLNGLEEGRVYNHAITVGVFLTPIARAFAGNFTVWPGSHKIYEKYFRERGPVAMKEPMPIPENWRASSTHVRSWRLSVLSLRAGAHGSREHRMLKVISSDGNA